MKYGGVYFQAVIEDFTIGTNLNQFIITLRIVLEMLQKYVISRKKFFFVIKWKFSINKVLKIFRVSHQSFNINNTISTNVLKIKHKSIKIFFHFLKRNKLIIKSI